MNDLITAFSGSSANFRCAADGTPAPDIIWLKDGMPFEKDHRVRMQKWSLKLDNINSDDEGIYTCLISNTEGSISFNFTLEITDKKAFQPIIIEDFSTNQTVYVGQTVVLECKFASNLHHKVQWVKYFEVNGSSTDEFGVPYRKIVEAKNGNGANPRLLILNNVTFDDAGKYACVVSDDLGSSSNKSSWITVLPESLVVEHGRNSDMP
ncbi:Fibroblast growth factor receptor 4, partial [Stegodyphus mimosarum]